MMLTSNMDIFLVFGFLVLYFWAGFDSVRRIHKRDNDCEFIVDIILVFLGILGWINVIIIQKVIYPDDYEYLSDEEKKEYLKKSIERLQNKHNELV